MGDAGAQYMMDLASEVEKQDLREENARLKDRVNTLEIALLEG